MLGVNLNEIVIVIVIVIFPMRALGSNLAPVHELPILGSYYVVAHRTSVCGTH